MDYGEETPLRRVLTSYLAFLMAEHNGQSGRRHPTFDLVQLRVADAACVYVDQYFATGR